MEEVVVTEGDLIVVTGAGGFIGGQLVSALLSCGYKRVRGVDRKQLGEWQQRTAGCEELVLDLRDLTACRLAVRGASQVFNLASDMGGIGFITSHKADCMLSVLINTHMLIAAREARVHRYFFSSSACVYAEEKQIRPDVKPLRESDAYPAMPEDGYGWEKLFSERMCRHFREDFGLETRIARYHNIYGPMGAYAGGREKAPAAICRKVAECALGGTPEIEIWGDGEQTRSFTYISDCTFGTIRLMASNCAEPINIGSEELISINGLVDLVEEIAGLKLRRRYNLNAPQGVRGRNSDNTMVKTALGWAPSISLKVGLQATYRWTYDQLAKGKVIFNP
jgi:nucleoside-diphosphate-sugar epimerase